MEDKQFYYQGNVAMIGMLAFTFLEAAVLFYLGKQEILDVGFLHRDRNMLFLGMPAMVMLVATHLQIKVNKSERIMLIVKQYRSYRRWILLVMAIGFVLPLMEPGFRDLGSIFYLLLPLYFYLVMVEVIKKQFLL